MLPSLPTAYRGDAEIAVDRVHGAVVEVDRRECGNIEQDALRGIDHEVLRSGVHRHAVSIVRRLVRAHDEQVRRVPPLLGDELGIAAEPARGEHDRLRVVLDDAVGAFRVRALYLAVLHDELVHGGLKMRFDVEILHALDHGLDVADGGFVALEPVEGGVEAGAVVVVDDTRVQDALIEASVYVFGRLGARVGP